MPYLGYFQAIATVDKYILYENLTFIKDAWMNRNKLMLNNGLLSMFSVPLSAKSSNLYIREVKIDNTQKWSEKLLKTIYLNYKKAVCFEETYQLLEKLLQKKYEYLYQLNAYTIVSISRHLGIQTEIVFDNNSYLALEEKLEHKDYSLLPYLNKTTPEKKTARVIAMCKMENADIFINAIGGLELYSKEEFAQYGINLKFIKMNSDIVYPQFSKKFVPNLTILDVMMFNSVEEISKMLDKYELI